MVTYYHLDNKSKVSEAINMEGVIYWQIMKY